MKHLRLKRKNNIIAGLIGSILTIAVIVTGTVIYARFFWKEETKQVFDDEYIHIDQLNKIIVSKVDILFGEQITEDMIETVYIDGDNKEYMMDSVMAVGKFSLRNIPAGMPIVQSVLYENIEVSHDLRNHEISFVELPSLLKKGDYIDIRISFPDGEDYIVVTKKLVEKVESLEGHKTMWINMLENERLHMSSAIVEAATYEGAKLYAICYVLPEVQEEAIVNYPVNENVYQLIMDNPNIVDDAIKRLTIRGKATYVKSQNERPIYE